jgi:putative membrane protein insertion efficiency factor
MTPDSTIRPRIQRMPMLSPRWVLCGLIKLYRWMVSPLLAVLFGPANVCRFTPTCSRYAMEAIAAHGAVTGSMLAAKRICRCNPLGGCGHDPVPETRLKWKPALIPANFNG